MYVMIHAVNEDSDVNGEHYEGGKKSDVTANEFEIISFDYELSIRASYYETHGTGERGGNCKTIVRRLVLNLDANDLKKIVNAAVAAKLVRFNDSRKVAEAKRHLEQALSVLSDK